jgi:hypothetical protein
VPDPPLEGELIPKAQPELLAPIRIPIDSTTAVATMSASEVTAAFAAYERGFLLLLGGVSHSEGVAIAVRELWKVPKSEYRKAFLDEAVLDQSAPARTTLHALWHEAVAWALEYVRVMTDREIREVRECLERGLVAASGREERYRAEAALAREMKDQDSARKAESEAETAADEAAKLRRQIDALPGLDHPLVVKYARGRKAALSEGIQRALYEFLHKIFVHHERYKTLVTAIANAVTDGVVTRFTLREDRQAWQSE